MPATTDIPLYKLLRNISDTLSPIYGAGEAKAMAQIIFENIKGWTPVDLAIRANEPISPFIQDKISAIILQLKKFEPIQYIFGNADFYGLKLKVTPDTLIPRPETAELVDLIVKQNPQKDLRVLDIATGSGCIALALSRNLLFPIVTGVDISPKALEVARQNASTLHASVSFYEADILQLPQSLPSSFVHSQWDIIVSNPPYIPISEKSEIEPNVLKYEPDMALFVPDSNPLMFYKPIVAFASNSLSSSGKLYLEINPLFSKPLASLCSNESFTSVDIIRDTFGKNRFIVASRR